MTLSRVPWWAHVVLLTLVLVGGFFRFHRLDQQGVLLADSANYLGEAKLWLGAGRLVSSVYFGSTERTPREILQDTGMHGRISHAGKPANYFLRALSMAIFGETNGKSNYLMAAIGTLSIIVLFGFTRRLFGDWQVSLIAAGLLALSPTHVEYSRGLKAEVDSMFFLMCALWCLHEGVVRQRGDDRTAARWRWAAGLVFGWGYAGSTRLTAMLPGFAILAVLEFWLVNRNWRTIFGSLTRFGLGFTVMLVFWELPYLWAMLAARQHGVELGDFPTYWGCIQERMKFSISDCRPESFINYFYLLARTDGILPALSLLGIYGVWRETRRWEAAIVVLVVVAGLGLYWYTPWTAMVLFSFSVPMLVVLAALGCRVILRWQLVTARPVGRGIVLGLMLVLIVPWDMVADWQDTQISTHLADATAWLKKNRPRDVVSAVSFEQTLCEYDNAHVVQLPLPLTMEYLQQAYRFGVRVLLIDPQKFNAVLGCSSHVMGPDFPIIRSLLPSAQAFSTPMVVNIESTTPPLATFTNEYNKAFFWIFAREHNTYLERTRLFMDCVDPQVDAVIRLYDLGQVLSNLQTTASR